MKTALSAAAALFVLASVAPAPAMNEATSQERTARAATAEGPGAAWTAPILCPLETAGWREAPFKGRAANSIACAEGALSIRSEDSISLYAIAPPAALARAEVLEWRWRVDQSGPPSDLREKGGDDRNLALYVALAWDPDQAGLAERMLRPLVEARSGRDAPGRLIAYTWAAGPAGLPERAEFDSPFGGAAHRVRVLRRGPGDWRRERVDLAADIARIFGETDYRIQYIAVVSDTDDLAGAARSRIGDITLHRGE